MYLGLAAQAVMERTVGAQWLGAMPQSLAFVLVHVVFSTKDRRPLLGEWVRPALYANLATVARGAKCDCFRVGGVADHVHLAIRMHPERNVSKLIGELKTSSSRWLKTQSPELAKFSWQRGYGAFSVSPADAGALLRYIDQQEAHHGKRSFQDEMRAFFEKYHVAFDERYVWDRAVRGRAFSPQVCGGRVPGALPQARVTLVFGPPVP